MGRWEKHVLGVRWQEVPSLIPGIAGSAAVAWLGTRLAQLVGVRLLGFARSPVSPVMMAMLVGLAIGNAHLVPPALRPGVRFSVRKVLRLGIILLGIRLSIVEVLKIGFLGVPVVALCIGTGLVVTTWLGHRLHLPRRLASLIAVGTGICGVSAIVATAPVIDADDEEVAYAVADITLFGALATFTYPYVAHMLLGATPERVGLFLGTSVHDTSQVTASALIFDQVYQLATRPSAADVAVVTKMVRNVFMAAVVPLIGYLHARRTAGAIKGSGPVGLLPLFVLGFLAVAVLRSIGDFSVQSFGTAFGLWESVGWSSAVAYVKKAAESLLVVALAGVGLDTNLKLLAGLGLKPIGVGFASALLVGVIGMGCAVLFGPLLMI